MKMHYGRLLPTRRVHHSAQRRMSGRLMLSREKARLQPSNTLTCTTVAADTAKRSQCLSQRSSAKPARKLIQRIKNAKFRHSDGDARAAQDTRGRAPQLNALRTLLPLLTAWLVSLLPRQHPASLPRKISKTR
jgi:hypothetical protein